MNNSIRICVPVVLALLICGPAPRVTAAPAAYSASDAIAHIGERALVYGTVCKVLGRVDGSVLLDLDGIYPNEKFTVVVVPQSSVPEIMIDNLIGHKIYVSGLIKMGKGDAKMFVDRPSQIRIADN